MEILNKLKKGLANPQYIILYFLHRFSHLIKDDKRYIELCYRFEHGGEINVDNPRTFNEKIQWLKLYYHNPLLTKLVDKYQVKSIVAGLIGESHIIPTYGVYDKFDEIDFENLPDEFVIKTTHGGGSLGVVVCKDKSTFDIDNARNKIESSLKSDYYQYREWAYKDVPRRILIEKYMCDNSDNNKNGISDYKFYCFNGEPQFLYMSQGLEKHETAKISFLTLDWKFADFRRSDYMPFEKLPEKPKTLSKMIDICRKLAKDFPFVRVDLYEIHENVYFSELTFYPCNGSMPFYPEKYDLYIGDKINLPSKVLEK